VKRLGPELKMPKLKDGGLKVPPFLSDLFGDLRDRRLLPLVALLLVGIVAAPILLKDGPSEPEAPVPSPLGGAPAPSTGGTLTVVKAQPGLRNYKKRLTHRSPTNPFKQQFTGPDLEGSELNEQTSATTTENSTTSETTVIVPSSSEGSPSSGGDANGNGIRDGLIFYTFVAKIQVTRTETKPDGSVEKTGPTVHDKVKPPSPLPGEKAPVVTYMGLGTDAHIPLFMISPEVTAVFGEGECVSGTKTCQVIALEPGFPETFVFGANDVRYKINVIKVEPLATGHS